MLRKSYIRDVHPTWSGTSAMLGQGWRKLTIFLAWGLWCCFWKEIPTLLSPRSKGHKVSYMYEQKCDLIPEILFFGISSRISYTFL